MASTFDLVVIGGGPAGYVGALHAAHRGMTVCCVEKEPILGGTCLRVGCIPSKSLLESSEQYHLARHQLALHGVKVSNVSLDLAALMQRKTSIVDGLGQGIDVLFQKNKIERRRGHGKILAPGRVSVEASGKKAEEISAQRVLIATGSKPAALRGMGFDGDRIASSTEALSWSAPPSELIVIGAGAIGLELGSVWRRLGSNVVVLEYLDRILPEMDSEVAQLALRSFKKQGIEFKLGCRVLGARVEKKKVTVEIENAEPMSADRVLVAVGRVPNTDGLGLDSVGIRLDERGRIVVNERFETSAAGVFAVGDVIAGPMLAHKASEEAVACVDGWTINYGHVNYDAIPSIVYTQPEVAGVGKTEDELKKSGIPYKKGTYPFRGIGRARILNDIDGMVKILAHESTDRVLGVHIVNNRAGDLIAEGVAAIEFGASSEDLARLSHAHPTLSECLKEASSAVLGRPFHS